MTRGSLLDRIAAGPGPSERAVVAVPAVRAPLLTTAATPSAEEPVSPTSPAPAPAPTLPSPAPVAIATTTRPRTPTVARPLLAQPPGEPPPVAPHVPPVTPPKVTTPRATPARRTELGSHDGTAPMAPVEPRPAPARRDARVVVPSSTSVPRVVASPVAHAPSPRIVHATTIVPTLTREVVRVVETRTRERVVDPAASRSSEPAVRPVASAPPGAERASEHRPLAPAAPLAAEPPRASPSAPAAVHASERPERVPARPAPEPAALPRAPLSSARGAPVVRPIVPRAAPPSSPRPAAAAVAARLAPRIEIQIGTLEIRALAPARRQEPGRIPARRHTLAIDGER